MLERLKKVSNNLGLPWGTRKMTYNSRLVQELNKWVETKGKGDQFRDSIFRAYFVDGSNIGKKEILIKLAKEVGLSVEEAEKVLKSRAFRAAVDEDWRLCMAVGIAGVPTFVIENHSVVGA